MAVLVLVLVLLETTVMILSLQRLQAQKVGVVEFRELEMETRAGQVAVGPGQETVLVLLSVRIKVLELLVKVSLVG